ncbi:MAG: aminopeptidase [Parcubacteria group bacterium]|nr:aminopeptidase [Parcubacteria group bacterium]
MNYTPPEHILRAYATVLVNFALGDGKGVQKGEVVNVALKESAKPLLIHIQEAILKAGGHTVLQYIPEGLDKSFFEHASNEQLDFFPEEYQHARAHLFDHQIGIISTNDKHELEDTNPEKIMRKRRAIKPYRDLLDTKEVAGNFSWTVALYGTEAMAREANLSLEAYWQEIINACFLDDIDPVAKWKDVYEEIDRVKNALNNLDIASVHIKAPGTNLSMEIGENRLWKGGGGNNIPSFEVFTSPDYHTLNGTITFTEPAFVNGNLMKGISLTFENGVVTDYHADQGEAFLKSLLDQPGGNRVGEFSMTDGRLSHITTFMGETLYDENVGGPEGNTHIAIGKSFHICYGGDKDKTPEKWDALGLNDSPIHVDLIATSPRTVTATLKDGTEKIIYQNGRFTV